MTQVFLSYSTKDAAITKQLDEELNASGIVTFKFDRDVAGGEDVIERLHDAFSKSDVFLLVLSESSARSRWCKKEQTIAINCSMDDEKKTVLPVLLDTPDKCELNYFLRYGFQWIDLRDRNNMSRVITACQPGSTAAIPLRVLRRSRAALYPVVLASAILLVLSLTVFGVRAYKEAGRLKLRAELRHTQQSAQEVDDEVERLLKTNAVQPPSKDGKTEYYRPGTQVHLATDTYEGLVLKKRALYRQDGLIAVDYYSRHDNVISGKTRKHLDSANRPYLIDEFDRNGLKTKRHCAEGNENDCISYLFEEQESPFAMFAFLPGFRYP